MQNLKWKIQKKKQKYKGRRIIGMNIVDGQFALKVHIAPSTQIVLPHGVIVIGYNNISKFPLVVLAARILRKEDANCLICWKKLKVVLMLQMFQLGISFMMEI